MRTANPTLKAFNQPQTWDQAINAGTVDAPDANVMTMGGTVTASAVLLGLTVGGAIATWTMSQNPEMAGLAQLLGIGGALVGLVLVFVISFKPKLAMFLAPVYAGAEGLLLGWFSYMVGGAVANATAEGTAVSVGSTLVFQAVTLTFSIAAGMLFVYATGIVKPGRVFRAVVMTGVAGAMLFFVVAMVMSLFGNDSLRAMYSVTNGSALSIGFSVVMIVIGALMLVLDFELISESIRTRQPKHMEWYAGFALLVTLVWLYIELLRLLAKLRSGD